jgi:hypothetical protein
MKTVKTRRFKVKDGFALVAILKRSPSLEEVSDTKSVVILARRDLIRLQRAFSKLKFPKQSDAFKLKRQIILTLDSLTKS